MKHKISFVGFGGMAGWHYKQLQTMDNISVAGIWDIKEDRRKAAADVGLHVYESFEDLLADERTDLVLLAVPNDVHMPAAVAALEAGKNVICEKPVCLNSEELMKMTDAAKKTGKFLTVHQNRRWDEDFLTVKQVLAEGKLGELFRIESRVHGSRGIPGDWRQEKEHGGGMILDWGVHLRRRKAGRIVPHRIPGAWFQRHSRRLAAGKGAWRRYDSGLGRSSSGPDDAALSGGEAFHRAGQCYKCDQSACG